MIKIQERVAAIIKANPMFEAALGLKVVNFSRLARKIKPLVEKSRMEKVGLGAIIMALRRLKLPEGDVRDKVLIDSLVLNSNLLEFVFRPSPYFLKKYAYFCKVISEKEGDSYVSLLNGPARAAVIISAKLRKDLQRHFKDEEVIARIENISAITLKFSQETPRKPGIFYPILRALAWDRISFIEIASSHAELSLFFEDQFVERAFSTIKGLTQPH